MEICGALFDNNLEVTFLYYVDEDPKNAFYEKNIFLNASDFEKELDRQIAPNFIPDMGNQKHVICKQGYEAEFVAM